MKNRFVTVDKDDPLFSSYISGQFSDVERALPVRSLNPGQKKQLLTFEISDCTEISKPSFFVVILHLFRWSWLSLLLGPLVVLVSYFNASSLTLNYLDFSLTTTSLLFAFGAAFMLDDYYDHISGMDISSGRRGSQVIQKGWLTSKQVQKIAYICLTLAVLLALPVLFQHIDQLWLYVALAANAILGYSYKGKGFKYQGWGDFWLFLCFGPLLMLSLHELFADETHIELLWTGIPLGWAAVLALQSRQFSNIMYDESSGKKTFVARMGFDRARFFIKASLLLCTIFFLIGHIWFHLAYGVVSSVLVVVPVALAFAKVNTILSPLSSKMNDLHKNFITVQLAMILALSLPYVLQLVLRH